MSRPACALVSIPALQHNFQVVRNHAPDSRIMAVIKANAYGHGSVQVANAFPEAEAFGVASIEEGVELRQAGITKPICLLSGFFQETELSLLAENKLDPVIHYPQQLDQLERYQNNRGKTPINVWLKIDTGMHRLGFAPQEFGEIWQKLEACAAVGKISLMSHLANADISSDPGNKKQIAAFLAVTSDCDTDLSLANSAGVLTYPDSCLDWVRPGIMLYGSSPVAGKHAHDFDLKPVMTLETELMAVYKRRKGQAIGYGGDWVCPRDMSIGVAAIGYGDGYPRHAPSGTPVLVNGKRANLVGRVSMDMITIDLSDQEHAKTGDRVVLWGEGLSVDEIAEAAGTISYELFCKVTKRVPRVPI